MKFLTDFFPVILFFLAYKFWGIYTATGVAIGASVFLVGLSWVLYRKVDKMQLVTLGLITVLGGATLIFHNDVFIKWKPTVINWLLGLVFWISAYFTKQPMIKTMMGSQINLPEVVWNKLNLSWIGFFLLSGFANLYVAYYYSTDIWVNFKLFGILGLTVLFIMIQAIYLARHASVNLR